MMLTDEMLEVFEESIEVDGWLGNVRAARLIEDVRAYKAALKQIRSLTSPKHFSEGRIWEIADRALKA